MRIPHPLHKKGGFFMENDFNENIITLKHRIKQDKDALGVFVGSPGEGKSTIAQQVAFILDPTITVDNIKYSYEDYQDHIAKLFHKSTPPGKYSKGKCIIHDEARESLSGLSVLTKRTRAFMDHLYTNRQANMFQFILTGDFFDLPKSIAMQRCLFMVWVFEEGKFQNGYFKFYNRPDLKRLYNKGKKDRNMLASKHTLRGRFPKFYTVDEDEYRKLKSLDIKPSTKKKDKKLTKSELIKGILDINPQAEMTDVCNVINCNHGLFYSIRKAVKVN